MFAENKYRTSHLEYFSKICVFKTFAKVTEKYLCRSLFLDKFARLWPVTLFIKRLRHKRFPMNFGKFLRTHLYRENIRWLLLKITELTIRVFI